MSFRPMLRPGQGFKLFRVLRKVGNTTNTGRPHTSSLKSQGEFYGMLTEASPEDIERYRKLDTPVTHTIVQRGTTNRAKAKDILELVDSSGEKPRRFQVTKDPKNPGELGHFLIYKVEERDDLQ